VRTTRTTLVVDPADQPRSPSVSRVGNTHITLMGTRTKNIGRGRTPGENPKNLAEAPVRALKITTNGQIRPLTYYNGNKVGDVRWVAGGFLLSLQKL
jgi:hypothetical protein